MTDRSSISIHAPAKVNLALSVGPPQADGMHPISSWMVTVDLVDDLHVTRLEGDRLSRYSVQWHEDARRCSDIDWSITSDLAVRAHLLLERHVGRRMPIQMKLDKRIPVGGGLGGGSSNAAAMLHAVNALFQLELRPEQLAVLGRRLGSDVPFLVRGGSAIVEGLGEILEHHETCPDIHLVLVLPEATCPTGTVYRLFDEYADAALRSEAVRALASSSGQLKPQDLFNDLAEGAARSAPGLQDELARLSDLAKRTAHVTGSGSSLFVLCDDALHAEALAAAIEQRLELPAVAVRACENAHVPCSD